MPLVDTVNRNPTRVIYWQGSVEGSSRRIFHAAIFTHWGSTIRHRMHKPGREPGHNFSLQVFNFFRARLRTLFAKREALMGDKARSEGRTGEEQFAEEGKSTEER